MGRHLCQQSPQAPLRAITELPPSLSPPDPAAADRCVVLACAPGPWDLAAPHSWPRVPGGAFVGRTSAGGLRCCGGFLPCGDCEPCRAGLHLACAAPLRPGWNAAGGLATETAVPPAFLAPLGTTTTALSAGVALLAAAGLTYQATASAGMAPGDTVLVFGEPGPGALPLRLLVALGLRPFWVTRRPTPVSDGVVVVHDPPAADDLPSPRRHLLDLHPSPASVARWAALARTCLSCTLLGPDDARLDLPVELLAGQAVLRWIRDLHPHLVAELMAIADSPRSDLSEAIECHGLDDMPEAMTALVAGQGRWPVLVLETEGHNDER